MKKLLLTLVGIVCSLGIWADVICSMSSPTGPTANLNSSNGSNLTATYENCSGYVYNGKASAAALVTNGQVNLGGSGNSYCKITISNGEIKVGDVIDVTDGTNSLVKSGGYALYVSTSTTKGSNQYNFPYTVKDGDAFVGKSELYFWKSGSSTFKVVTITGNRTSSNTPSFTTNLSTTAYEAVATKEFSLSVAVADYTSLKWYSCDDVQGTNAKAISGATQSTYKFTPETTGTQYFYCVATNDNATGDKTATSNIATVNIVENTSYVITWANVGGWSLRAPSGMTSGSEFDKNTTIALSADNGASYHFVGWTVNGEQVSTENAYTHTVTEAAEIKGIYEANKKLIFADTKQEAYADKDGKITVPQNWYNYVAGKTVVSWTGNDGNTYEPGDVLTLTEDVTLTPNYATNQKKLAYGATVTWSFAFPNSAPLFNSIQGTGAVRNYVQQANIDGVKIDVNMVCDATSGKMDNARRMSNDLTQVNNGTKFTIPAVSGMTVKVNANGNMSATTIAGSTSYEGTGSKNITYTYEGSDETIDIVINDGSYLSSIVVTYPATAEDPTKSSTIYSANITATGKVSFGAGISKQELTSSQVAVEGGKMYVTNEQDKAKELISTQSSVVYLAMTNGNTYFTVELSEGNTLKSGDVITATMSAASRGLKFGTGTSYSDGYPGEASSTTEFTYTVVEDDGICGESTFNIFRATGNSTYFKDFTISRPATVASPTLNASGYATFSSEYGVQIKGAKAYKAVLTDSKLVCTEIEGGKVPAGVGVILYGEDGAEITASYCADAPAVEGNELKATTLADGSLAEKEESLVLSGNSFKYFNGTAFTAGKAYLPYSTTNASKSFVIVFEDIDNTATGINTVETSAKKAVKTVKNGKLVINVNGVEYNAVGAMMK